MDRLSRTAASKSSQFKRHKPKLSQNLKRLLSCLKIEGFDLAFWLISSLLVATISAIGALTLGLSISLAFLIYTLAGFLTLVLGLAAAFLDDISDQGPATDAILPAE